MMKSIKLYLSSFFTFDWTLLLNQSTNCNQDKREHYSDLDKRLLGVFFDFRKIAPKVLRGDLDKRLLGVFWPDHTPMVKLPNFITGL